MSVKLLAVCFLVAMTAVCCEHDSSQHPEAIDKRTTGDGEPEETTIQTQIAQLYQIYKATQNNIIMLNTELSLINEQLTSLRESMKAIKIETKDDIADIKAQVRRDVTQLVADIGSIQNNQAETTTNISQLNDGLNSKVENFSGKLEMLEHRVKVTNDSTLTSIDNVHTTLTTATTQLSSLQSVVNGLNTVQHSTTAKLHSLQSSVNNLTTRVDSPVNLYQNCIHETRRCTLGLGSIWRGCATASLLINSPGYYTTDMRCEYEASAGGNFESSILFKDGDNVRCECGIIRPGAVHRIPGYETVIFAFSEFTPVTGTCSLVITRCPLTTGV